MKTASIFAGFWGRVVAASVVFASALFLAGTAQAQGISDADRAQINAHALRHIANYRDGNLRTKPPKAVQNALGKKIITSLKGVTDLSTLKPGKPLSKENILSFDMSFDKATYALTNKGRPYGLFPTKSVIRTTDGTIVQTNSTTLIYAEAGTYFITSPRPGGLYETFIEVYPEFASLSVPADVRKEIVQP